jgi:hypothetical protein
MTEILLSEQNIPELFTKYKRRLRTDQINSYNLIMDKKINSNSSTFFISDFIENLDILAALNALVKIQLK